MKTLTCEICGSTNLIKQDGVFVCQSCETKYSVEDAKKMMADDESVKITGTVKIDTSSELTNLYEIARRAKDNGNSENAVKYYDMILVKDPSSWEANFYVVYFKAMSCKIAEIRSAAVSVRNCIDSVLTLVKEHVTEETIQKAVINEVYLRVTSISDMLYNAATNHYNEIDSSIRGNYVEEFLHNVFESTQIVYVLGDCLVNIFNDSYRVIATEAWKAGIKMHNEFLSFLGDKETNKKTIQEYAAKVKQFDTGYQTPELKTSSNSCYIATAVYGSYDCKEVWVLRRFRDYILSEIWYGRLFIKTYYAISPSFVKWFGTTKWFKKICRIPLDKLVRNLHDKGIDNTPYHDK